MDTALQEAETLSAQQIAALGSLPASSKRFRVVYFMRSVTCPLCRAHVVALGKRYAQLQGLGVDVCGLVPEPDPAGAELKKQLATPFEILASSSMFEAFGFSRALLGSVQQSGTLVIENGKTQRYLRRATMPFNALNERELLASIEGAPPP